VIWFIMIDWLGVATNGLWLLGLAVSLAVFTYADWSVAYRSWETRYRLRDMWGQAAVRRLFWGSLMLFCVGVALSGGRWWERILWGVLAVMAVAEAWRARRLLRS
jgi:hypothetical protein